MADAFYPTVPDALPSALKETSQSVAPSVRSNQVQRQVLYLTTVHSSNPIKNYYILVVFCYYYLDHQNEQCAAILSPTSSEVVCMRCGPSLSALMPPPSVPNSEEVPEVKKSLGS